ncbi:hypothetical protein Tco_0909503 [Tanacetum coccineum]|uniref:Uncharacterized protein n=1 Tax=Tanacetum coccineum TaxID=301880 RepID=A0ABQ5CQN5_9ASTR
MSQEDMVVDGEETDSDFDDEIRPPDTLEYTSKPRPIKKFTYVTKSGKMHQMTKEEIKNQKGIKELAKVEAVRRAKGEWLKFNNREFSADSRKEFSKRHSEISIKEIKRHEALNIDKFGALHEGVVRIHKLVVRKYIIEFLSSRHNGKEKVTLDDLFLLHSMDGGVRVDVPWHVGKFFIDKAKGYKKKSLIVGAHLIGRIARSYGLITQGSLRSATLRLETSLLNVAKLVDLGICRYNGLGYGELVDDIPDNDEDEGAVDAGDDDAEGVRCRPNMSFTNRLRAMDERLGEIETDIYRLGRNVDDLTYIVFGMSEWNG